MQGSECSNGERGFALAVVLWLLLATAVVVGAIMAWTGQRVEDARRARVSVEDAIAAVSNRERLLFVGATVPTTQGGLPRTALANHELALRRLDEFGRYEKRPLGDEIRLDGTPYIGLGGVWVTIQDESGLVPIAFPSEKLVPLLLEHPDLSAARQRALFDALLDYTDDDDLRRLLGAERRQYERAGRPSPPNRPLLVVSEAMNILGWDALPDEVLYRFQRWSTVVYAGPFNLNSAPTPLLLALFPNCDARCAERLQGRSRRPFLSSAEFEQDTGLVLPGDRDVDYRTAPSESWRITAWGEHGRALRMHVRLTPMADGGSPWTVDSAYETARPDLHDADRSNPTPLFPDPSVVRR